MVELNKIYCEDCLTTLKRMDDDSIDCVVTSPPYFGLRKYSDDEREIGREDTPAQYIDNMVEIFQEVYRVLKSTGTVWVNIGDSYENKNLLGVPWTFALEMRDRLGFYLRQDIIWEKGNALPESVKDRCVKSHEYIFLFSKSKKYYFDYQAIQEPSLTFIDKKPQEITQIRFGGNKYGDSDDPHHATKSGKEWKPQMKNLHRDGQTIQGMHKNRAEGGKDEVYAVRNKRDVWSVNTQPSTIEHCAMYPEKLILPCILAGCPPGGIVYDPFGGSCTTALATIHSLENRNFIMSELSPKYAEIARKRIEPELNQTKLF